MIPDSYKIITNLESSIRESSSFTAEHQERVRLEKQIEAKNDINISISASAGKGKTLLVVLIAEALSECGFDNVTINDFSAADAGFDAMAYKHQNDALLQRIKQNGGLNQRIKNLGISITTHQKPRSCSSPNIG